MLLRLKRNPRGFTLIELLIVISIVTLLIALLLPAIRKSKFNVKDVLCAHHLHQWGVAFNVYAVDHDESLPRQDMAPPSGGNLWDIAPDFLPALEEYGMLRKYWFCPFTPAPFRSDSFIELHSHLHHFAGYSVWVPRRVGSRIIPSSDLGYPTRLNDPAGLKLPIVTDVVWSDTAMTITAGDFVPMAWHKYPSMLVEYRFAPTFGGNFWPYGPLLVPGGRLINGNLLFVDGHAESRHPAEMQYRYTGNIHHFY